MLCRRASLDRSTHGQDEAYRRSLMRELERKETEYHRLRRQRKKAEDFEPLTIIGRGAFGEVSKQFLSRHIFILPRRCDDPLQQSKTLSDPLCDFCRFDCVETKTPVRFMR